MILSKSLKKSFSLVEISIVIIVISILISVSWSGMHTILDTVKTKKNQQKINNIKNALQNYFNINGRLPRPALYTYARNNTSYGTEREYYNGSTCSTSAMCYNLNDTIWTDKQEFYKMTGLETDMISETITNYVKYNSYYTVYYGIVPFKELSLTENDIIDAYGNYIEYWVDDYMTMQLNEEVHYKIFINNSDNNSTFPFVPYKHGYGVMHYIDPNIAYPCGCYKTQYTSYLCTDNDFICNKETNSGRYAIMMIQRPDTTITTTTKRKNNLYISKSSEIIFYHTPYAFRVKNIQDNRFIDDFGTIAYVLVSHGPNGKDTCAITRQSSISASPKIIKKLTSANATAITKYEAQNCLSAEANTTLNIIGRNAFSSAAKNTQITFYKGDKNTSFDDIVEYTTLSDLITNLK